ncbi:MAG: ABC-2 type transport system ATP-binding protein [Candidatus Magnetoglobus multicellularis str. Araruama]|uniref:ABC-2 type transport system ATP-binding protein n=1 Tax=Candidatus Magnetoglobus multicellularis str. Araruama TaxID=890399 RepID=A0A1V1PI23_9BACT|nr:MAG: ABC-2 type transport system ATP-binding protein [Candidatus Magnetoglobus multicellularis str. Araruama]
MIKLIHLTKQYGEQTAINNIHLTVKAGEIFGFIGPNGAGKTTTIQIMAGLLLPNSGNVLLSDISMIDNPVKAKQLVGYIPDRPFIYEKLTGIEYMRFIGDFYQVSEASFKKRSEKLLHQFALWDRRNELIEAYSHGMKQRLIMGSALLHEPPIIIVDEPMVGLDPVAIKLVRDIFQKRSQGGTTIFMSTHTLNLAEQICHRVGIIHNGQLIATGSMADLKATAKKETKDLEDIFFQLTFANTMDNSA